MRSRDPREVRCCALTLRGLLSVIAQQDALAGRALMPALHAQRPSRTLVPRVSILLILTLCVVSLPLSPATCLMILFQILRVTKQKQQQV